MNRLRIHLALHDQSFERKVAATAQAAHHHVLPVHLDAVINNARAYDTMFIVEEDYGSTLGLIEFHNSCLFNFLPVILVTCQNQAAVDSPPLQAAEETLPTIQV